MPISGAALLGTVQHQLKEIAAEEDRGALRHQDLIAPVAINPQHHSRVF